MIKTIKKVLSVLLLVSFVFISCAVLTGCGDEAPKADNNEYEMYTKRFTDGELLNLVEDELQLVGHAVLNKLSKEYHSINSIGNFDIAKWEYDGETYKGSGIGEYHAYGTCAAYDKYGDYYDSYKFEAIVELKDVDSYYEYTYFGNYSSNDAAKSLGYKYIDNYYSVEYTVEVFSKY